MNAVKRTDGLKYGLGLGTAVVAGYANAAIDTAAIVTAIEATAAAAGAIGVAILLMHYGIKAYKWLKGAG